MNIRKISVVLIAILFSFSLTCFAANATTKEAPPPVTKPNENVYTEDKVNITVTPNQPVITIKLKSNPTTGFSWFLRDYDETILTPISQQFEKASGELMGAPGFEIWSFRVKPAGFVVPQQSMIRMVYARPWQGSDTSTQLVFRVSTLKKALQ